MEKVNDREFFELLQNVNKKNIIDLYEHNLTKEESDKMMEELKNKTKYYEENNIIPTIADADAYDLIKKESNEMLALDTELVSADPKKYLAIYSNILELFRGLNTEDKWYDEAKKVILEVGKKHQSLSDWCNKITDSDAIESSVKKELDDLIARIDEKLAELEKAD